MNKINEFLKKLRLGNMSITIKRISQSINACLKNNKAAAFQMNFESSHVLLPIFIFCLYNK